MTAVFRNTPVPIMDPTTMAKDSLKPSRRSRWTCFILFLRLFQATTAGTERNPRRAGDRVEADGGSGGSVSILSRTLSLYCSMARPMADLDQSEVPVVGVGW